MTTGVGYACTRYAFFGFNVVFWLLGWGALGVGIWLYLAKDAYSSLTPAHFGAMSAAGLCMAAGAIVIVLGIVGCCGALVRSKYLLIIYFAFVGLLFIVQLSTGVLGLIYREQVKNTIRMELFAHLNSPYVSESATDPYGIKITWDKMQQEFSCCGVDVYKDWFRSSRWPSNDFVPDSCCDPYYYPTGFYTNCGKLESNVRHWFKKGCYRVFGDWLTEHTRIVGFVGLLFAFVELFILLVSVLLLSGVGNGEKSLRLGVGDYYYHNANTAIKGSLP